MQKRGSPGMADPKHPRKFSEEFKRQIVQLYDNGKSPGEIKAEYDIGNSTLHRWVRAIHENGSTRAADNRTPEQQRILELEKENKQLRMEVDVLKTAALIFARK
jgi:transposase